MSLFNKIRTFPEYHDAYDAVTANNAADQKIIDNLTKAFGADFQKFYKAQPEDLHAPLSSIQQSGQNQGKILTDLHSTLNVLPQDFHVYLDSYETKKKKQSEVEGLESEAKKSEEKAKAAETKLAQLRSKGSPDVAKQEALSVQLRSKATSDNEKAVDARQKFEEYNKEYQTNFAGTFITMMEAFFAARQKAAKQLATVGTEIENAVQQFHEYNDKNIASLREKLKQYEAKEI